MPFLFICCSLGAPYIHQNVSVVPKHVYTKMNTWPTFIQCWMEYVQPRVIAGIMSKIVPILISAFK